MRTAILLVLSLAAGAFALQDLNFPNNFSAGDTIKASNFQANNDSLENLWARNQDSSDAVFIRFTDLSDGDSTLDSLRVNAIRSNPDIDSIKGNPRIDSASIGLLRTDSLALSTYANTWNINNAEPNILAFPASVAASFDTTNNTFAFSATRMTATLPGTKTHDTLATITGGGGGDILIIQGTSNGDTLTIDHSGDFGAGTILNGALTDIDMIGLGSVVVLLKVGVSWFVLSSVVP